jgi:hypothetical protein
MMDILNLLTEQLGVTEDQAKGGAGAIFNLVKDSLSGDQFNEVAAAVPNMQELLAAAPAGGGLGGAIGGLTSMLGGGAEKLGGLASLAGSFKALDLDMDMVTKFVPVILSFVKSQGGDSLKNMLAGVLN